MEFDKDSIREVSSSRSNADNLSSTKSSSLQPPPLQLKEDSEQKSSKLPHNDQIESAFGNNDLSTVNVNTSASASKASKELGASAMSSPNSVVFAGPPDLHTAAHEVAHTVQQGKKEKD